VQSYFVDRDDAFDRPLYRATGVLPAEPMSDNVVANDFQDQADYKNLFT
jgi:hypothetical protein